MSSLSAWPGLNVTRIGVISIVTRYTCPPEGTDRRLLLTVAAAVKRMRARQRGRDGGVRMWMAVGVASHLILRI